MPSSFDSHRVTGEQVRNDKGACYTCGDIPWSGLKYGFAKAQVLRGSHDGRGVMRSLLCTLSLLATSVLSAPAAPQWSFDVKASTSGIVALEAIVVSPTLVLWFDRASDDPLQINNHSAWGALWNLKTSSVTPLDVVTNSFCASGALLSNGSMVRSCLSA